MNNRLKRAARLIHSLRQVKVVWIEIYSRPLSRSVEAATVGTKKVWAAVGRAMDAGATEAQIHKAMDDAVTARRRYRRKILRG